MKRRGILVLLVALVALPAVAGPLGGLATVGGGIRAAWLASHGREWTTALTQAIFGAAILAAVAL